MQDCSVLLKDINRLEALRQTELFGSEPEEAFTRLNQMATKVLKAPISIFSLIGDKSQFFKSSSGFEIKPESNEVPIDVSVCQYSLQGKPLCIEDTLNHPVFSDNPAVKALNIVGYLGVPVITKTGHPIGAVCVIDHKKRIWSDDEIELLQQITASFISEIELRQALRASERESKLREEFIAIASHELKNPLSAVRLQSQILLKKLSADRLNKSDTEKFVHSLQRQTQRLELMIDDMSDSTRLSTGKFTLLKDEVVLDKLIENTVETLNEQFTKSDLKVSLNLESNIRGIWDASRIEQVITNLLINASKYAPGSLVKITLSRNSTSALISISDSGPGISKENQSKIFDRYGRVSDASSIQGLGLGLYISRQIILQHGGNLELESALGKGSSFTISLPWKAQHINSQN